MFEGIADFIIDFLVKKTIAIELIEHLVVCFDDKEKGWKTVGENKTIFYFMVV